MPKNVEEQYFVEYRILYAKKAMHKTVMAKSCTQAKMLLGELMQERLVFGNIIQAERLPSEQWLKQSLVIDKILSRREKISNKGGF